MSFQEDLMAPATNPLIYFRSAKRQQINFY